MCCAHRPWALLGRYVPQRPGQLAQRSSAAANVPSRAPRRLACKGQRTRQLAAMQSSAVADVPSRAPRRLACEGQRTRQLAAMQSPAEADVPSRAPRRLA
jgi:hypothetical protein